jgi:hypothetical protein
VESSQSIHPSVQAMLQNLSNLFAAPSSLPPMREIDHGIPLKEGIEPVNGRPYRYAHYQKNEIEKQVQEMLRVGLVPTASVLFLHDLSY